MDLISFLLATENDISEEEIEDIVNGLLKAGENVSLSYDDQDGELTISSSDTVETTRTDVSESGTMVVADVQDINFGSLLSVNDDGDGTVTISGTDTQKSDEEIQDIVNSFLKAGTGITLSYDDASNSLTVTMDPSDISLSDLSSKSHSELSDSPSDAHHSRYSDSEAQSACEGSIDAESVDGYDIQKNGEDGQGIINFKT